MHNYIKFVDNYYSEKFRVPDGGEITVWDSYDNELSKFRCEYMLSFCGTNTKPAVRDLSLTVQRYRHGGIIKVSV